MKECVAPEKKTGVIGAFRGHCTKKTVCFLRIYQKDHHILRFNNFYITGKIFVQILIIIC
jgi:hypothetical protein